MKSIQYAVHKEELSVISRVGSELAWPILDFEEIGKDGDFSKPLKYNLEKLDVLKTASEWNLLVWTRYIPNELKNVHRLFWGMKTLPIPNLPQTLEELLKEHRVSEYYDLGPICVIYHSTGSNIEGIYHYYLHTKDGFKFLVFDDEKPDTKKRKV